MSDGSVDWYNPNESKKDLSCIMNGCIPCTVPMYCTSHDKPAAVASVPGHCSRCGNWLYDPKRDTKGIFGE